MSLVLNLLVHYLLKESSNNHPPHHLITMKLSIALLVTTLAAAEASGASKWANLRRRLSFEKVAGYMPGSQVRHRSVSLSAL